MVSADRSYFESRNKRLERLAVSMFEMAPDAMLLIDCSDYVSIGNSRAQELFQCFKFDIGIVKAVELFPEWNQIKADLISTRAAGTPKVVTVTALRQLASDQFIAEIELSYITAEESEYIGLIVRDVSKTQMEKRELETTFQQLQNEKTRLEVLVRQDSLTQVLNRRGLENILSREAEYARRNRSSLLAAIVDLDNFKLVNDTYGHCTGDLVLRHVAGILKHTVRAIDWVGRIGGDEFLLLLPDTTLMKGAKVAERVRLELANNSVQTMYGLIQQTASFGLVALPVSICTIEEVLELTKNVLKQSKSRGKNCVSTGDLTDDTSTTDEITITRVLGGLEYYRSFSQPIVDLHSTKILGYELNVRGPSGLEGETEELFRKAHQNNTVALLDLHCLNIALTATKDVASKTMFYLNLCSSTLVDIPVVNMLERVQDLMLNHDVCFELSARTMPADPNCLLEPIRELRRHGIKIAFSDFGFGHSPLEFLLCVMPDYIKLHRSMSRQISSNNDNATCIRNLVMMVSHWPVQIIADGVENKEDAAALTELGVRYGQGQIFEHQPSLQSEAIGQRNKF